LNLDPLEAVHFHKTDPGVRWSKGTFISIDLDRPLDSTKILTPNVIQMDGGYRMYYTGLGPARKGTNGYILSAYSHNAETWTKDEGIRVDVCEPDGSLRTLCPDVIPLAHGGYRMYFEARAAERPTVILSAASDDGLDWSVEPGVRFGDDHWSYGSPRCIYIDDSSASRLYFHRYTYPMRSGIDAGNVIISAISTDGLTFEAEPGTRIPQETERETYAVYAPEVLRLGDGSYRIYYAAWTDEIAGGVFTATSEDGLTWRKDADVCVDLGSPLDCKMVSKPCVIELADGRSRLFYEASDSEGRCRILSATSPIGPPEAMA
jgi:predicted GH43/DUF377 family glycosyl hydrolase